MTISDETWFHMIWPNQQYWPGKDYPTGKEFDADDAMIRSVTTVFPDLDILIQKIGGGASPEGYAAFSGDNDEILAEGWTEDSCFWQLYSYLLDGEYHPSFQCNTLPDFPPKNKYQEQLMLSLVMCQAGIHAGAFERARFNHDVDDVCLSITNGGLES